MFEEGAMGEAPGGGSLSTYKELCAMATDLGQPDLVYKFMDLANHQVQSFLPSEPCPPARPLVTLGRLTFAMQKESESCGAPNRLRLPRGGGLPSALPPSQSWPGSNWLLMFQPSCPSCTGECRSLA